MHKFKNIFEMILFVLKVSFVGFGGGNALMPLIKSEAVDKKKWLSIEEFDKVVIVSNLLPGPSVIQTIGYISIKFLGKMWGTLVTLLALLPHVLFAFGLYLLVNLLPIKYLYVVSVGVLSAIVGVLIIFGIRYIKLSHKNMPIPLWVSLFCITFAFCFFIPSPYNVPIVVMTILFILIAIVEFIIIKKSKKVIEIVDDKNIRNEDL
ncbi:chromate transporter [Mycoplasma crocodyli]|nr:chromate transporter [Mycoplasma crocodyli]